MILLQILSTNAVDSVVFFQKNLKFVLGYMSKLVALTMGLLLLPMIENIIFQEAYYKKYMLLFFGTSSFKIIFTLLIEIVAFLI